MSLLSRVLFLVVLAFVPAAAIQVYQAHEIRQSRSAEIRSTTLRSAEHVARQQERIIDAARQMIAALSQVQSVRLHEIDRCRELLQRVIRQFPQYAKIDTVDLQGRSKCTVQASNKADPPDHANSRYARPTVSGPEAVPSPGDAIKVHGLQVSQSIRDNAAKATGTITATIDANWLDTYLNSDSLVPGVSLLIADGNGKVLASKNAADKRIEQLLPAVFLPLLTREDAGTIEVTGVEEPNLLIAYLCLRLKPSTFDVSVPFSDLPPSVQMPVPSQQVWPNQIGPDPTSLESFAGTLGQRQIDKLFVFVYLDRDAAFAGLDGDLRDSSLALAAGLATTLLCVWLLAQQFLLKPIRTVTAAIHLRKEGDRSARVGLPQGRDEFATLGQAFDEMAEAAEERERLRREAEQALADSERRYRFMADSVPAIVWTADADSSVDFIGARLIEYLGAGDVQDYLGTGWTKIIHPDDLATTLAALQTARETRSRFETEYRLRLASGTYRWNLVRAVPMVDDNNNIIKWFGSIIDVDDQKNHARDLADAKEAAERATALACRQVQELESIYSNAPVGLWLGDRECRFVRVNDLMADINGFATADHIGRTVRELVPEIYDHIKPYYDGVLTTAQPVDFEVTGTTARMPGVTREWVVSYYPLIDKDGDVYAVSAVVREVTEERQAKRALAYAKEEAEQANQSKSKFLAAASHDIRQPLQSIILFANALERHVTDADGKAKLANLELGLDTLKVLLDALLDISRMESGAIDISIEDIPFNHFLEQIEAAYQPVATGRGLSFSVYATRELVVRSDRLLLGRMIRNIVENALRFTDEGGVEIVCAARSGKVLLKIKDTGIGIPKDHISRIWDEFHQVGNAERNRTQGIGLGLAIVRRLSGLLHHHIEITSEVGRGSTFSIELPLGSEAREHCLAAPVAENVAVHLGTGRLALVVDDDAIVLMGLRAMLKEWDFDVLTTASTDQMLDLLSRQSREPDLIIADYHLRQGKFGTEAIARIREHCGKNIPGVILTGETGAECQQDAEAHKLDIIYKPVTPRQLTRVVDKLLSSAETLI